ncbi:sulfotransferase family 2 domain-containing protein [Salinisphaera sp. T5B8]|jgi:hypothetical protein|uniref:sulfotransferase family 2 domain-containing protein n=1 Tax=Salinisphaera sp. T5B8 TaxID=1304154 RepID=UPI00333EEB4E
MPIFTKGNKSVLFIHIPKSAGSSVEKIAAYAGWTESFSIRGRSLREIPYCRASFQHLHAAPLGELFRFDKFDAVFTIVRNPFDRVKSEYYWQRVQGLTHLSVAEWVGDRFSRYQDNPFLCDNHIRPQIEFVPNGVHVDIFKLEDKGVEGACQIFGSRRAGGLGNLKNLKHALTRRRPRETFEKKSCKNSATEADFEKCYKDIVKFYRSDFDAFSYQVREI